MTTKMKYYVIIFVFLTAVNESVNLPKSLKDFRNEKGSGSLTEQIHREEKNRNETFPCEEYADCNHPKKVCNCDPSCELFNDCCSFNYESTARSDKQRSIVSLFKSCLQIGDQATWVIDRCPEHSSKVITHHNNTELFQILPVTDRFNITYRNAKIAECHGVFDYLSWRITITDVRQKCNAMFAGTVMANSITKLIFNKNLTLHILAELLLENSCRVNHYPPDGRSSHYCPRTVIYAKNCSSKYRPIYNVPDESINNPFQNFECCKMFNKCTTDYLCLKRPLDPANPFDDTRGEYLRANSKSSMILLDFNKKNHYRDIAVQYLNIKYEREFTFNGSHYIDKEDLLSVYCMLKQYLEANSFKIEQIKLRFYEAQESPQTRYITSAWFLLNSKRLLDLNGVEELERWLNTMKIHIVLQETSDTVIVMETGRLNLENISMLEVHKFSPSRARLSFFHESLRTSSLCRHLNEANTSPPRWCRYLHIKVMTAGGAYNTNWTCALWIDNIRGKGLDNIAGCSIEATHRDDFVIIASYLVLFCFY